MTTSVKIDTHAGWNVDVIVAQNGIAVGPVERVPPNSEKTFYLHSTQDLLIREVQPDADLPTTDRMLQFFAYEHLPPHLQAVSRPFGDLARHIVRTLPSNAERTAGLRKLLEAKDCAVRALLFKADAA